MEGGWWRGEGRRMGLAGKGREDTEKGKDEP